MRPSTEAPNPSAYCLQGFAACTTGSVGCWTYGNISGGRLNHSVDCDWHAAPWVVAPLAVGRRVIHATN